MPLIIAHRGLVNGPDKDKENTLTAFLSARSQGFDVEIDVWYDNYKLYIGHDTPMYETDIETLQNISRSSIDDLSHAWIHCKNINAIFRMNQIMTHQLNFFFHENDPVTLTSNGYVWTFPGQQLTSCSICVLPELIYAYHDVPKLECYGFCTDRGKAIRNLFDPTVSNSVELAWPKY